MPEGGGGGWSTQRRSTFASRWDKSTSKAILQGILDAVTLPGDVYRGEVDPRSDEAIGRAFDLASGMTLGAGAVPAGANELRMGIRAYHGSPHNYAAERLVKRPDGSTEYLVGAPDQLPDVPEGYEVIKDFPLGRQRMDKIGTGEGNQAFGHGLYNAEAEGTASTYKFAGQARNPIGQGKNAADHVAHALKSAHRAGYSGDEAKKEAKKYLQEYANSAQTAGQQDFYDAINNFDELVGRSTGHMYQTEIAADPSDFLDWDKPLSEQSPHIQHAAVGTKKPPDIAALRARAAEATGAEAEFLNNQADFLESKLRDTGEQAYRYLSQPQAAPGRPPSVGLVAEHEGRRAAAEQLRQAGIPGIRYLDQGSRAVANTQPQRIAKMEKDIADLHSALESPPEWTKTMDTWSEKQWVDSNTARLQDMEIALAAVKQEKNVTSNYVIFDDSLISILKKYGVVGPVLAALGLSQALPDRAEASEQQGGGW